MLSEAKFRHPTPKENLRRPGVPLLLVAWLEGILGALLITVGAMSYDLEPPMFTIVAWALGTSLVGAGWTATRRTRLRVPLQVGVVGATTWFVIVQL